MGALPLRYGQCVGRTIDCGLSRRSAWLTWKNESFEAETNLFGRDKSRNRQRGFDSHMRDRFRNCYVTDMAHLASTVVFIVVKAVRVAYRLGAQRENRQGQD